MSTHEIGGRPPKKVWDAIFYNGLNNRREAYVLAVTKEKAEEVIKKRYPRALIFSITYYGEIYK